MQKLQNILLELFTVFSKIRLFCIYRYVLLLSLIESEVVPEAGGFGVQRHIGQNSENGQYSKPVRRKILKGDLNEAMTYRCSWLTVGFSQKSAV